MSDDQHNPFERKDSIIAEAMALAEKRSGKKKDKSFLDFMEHFYAHAAPDDVADQPADWLVAIAHYMWTAGETRQPGTPKIEVFNPRHMKNGWQTPHTAIAVVNDDMPFLVDSITGGLAVRHRYRIHAVHHPILMVRRSESGRREEVLGAVDYERGHEKARGRESYIYLEIDAQSDPETLEDIRTIIADILADVRLAVRDWRAMLSKIDETAAMLTRYPPPVEEDQQQETIRFLRWLGSDRFTFLGYREYRFEGEPANSDFHAVRESGLGILEDPERYILRGPQGMTAISAEIRHFLSIPEQPVIITKANVKATVHRPVHMDYVGIKIYDADGRVIGEHRFVGLFTSQTYSESPFDAPLLRRKMERVQRRALFDKSSHAGKALRHILESFPRDELFQISEDHLLRTALGVLHLMERPRPRAFIRRDQFERFVSALVYVPRDVYHSGLREEIADILCDAYNGEVSVYYAQLSEDVLARWHFIIRTRPGDVPDADVHEINHRIAEAVKGWPERLREKLIAAHGEEEGNRLAGRYGDVFSAGYRDHFTPESAVLDIVKLEQLFADAETPIAIDIYTRPGDDPETLRLKFYRAAEIIPLSDCLPMLENLGFRVITEHAYRLEQDAGGYIHDFRLRRPSKGQPLKRVKPLIEDLLLQVWTGRIEDDAFNGLVLEAGLDWRQITVLRAYGRYLRQLGLPFGQAYVTRCLVRNAGIAAGLFEFFRCKFDPAEDGDADERATRAADIRDGLREKLDAVASPDQDRILRTFINLIDATVRTSFYQDTDAPDDVTPGLAIKLRSREIEEAPLPRPWREIFVYSPRFEGIHLRWGPVARGGLRWSDRPQDFRTEVLDLVKAQQVKNSVIVPVGAKGGFVPRQLPPASDREGVQAEGTACYKSFIASLLSITDNLVDGEISPPVDTVRHDGDDPYLVVAADKGTARFSDTANAIAAARGFWLDDAFASGGSQGYDHKAMAITARGAWVSVERHFREMGVNVAEDPVTVIGVGDMSGDVFGNGMLLSRVLRLKAAFDHRHVFLDPDPDAEKSWHERKRMFDLPRSSWEDYDSKLISPGGGVWPRTAKSIPLSSQVREMLGVSDTALPPGKLINRILRMEADLLWFGGIGTYVKAPEESHGEAGDRGNDAIRIDADQLRVKVVGEGANLGMTQPARIVFARRGGRLNTDFIDNSAGVDCSDKEVNIKILLSEAVRSGQLGMKARNRLLEDMTEDVARIVLTDNYLQTQAISQAEAQSPANRESHAGLIRTLEREGTLNRDIEHLPSEEEISELAVSDRGLTRPELAVVMAYAKLSLKVILVQSDLLDAPEVSDELLRNFPERLHEPYAGALREHRLRRELLTSSLVNQVVDRGGLTFVFDVREETGMGVDQIVSAFLIVRDIFRMSDIWPAIEALDYRVEARVQTRLMQIVADFIKRQTVWFLHNEERPFDFTRLVSAYRDGVDGLMDAPEAVLSPLAREDFDALRQSFTDAGVPEDLARRVAALPALQFACDIEQVADQLDRPVEQVGRAYSEVGHSLGYDWLRSTADPATVDDHWDRLAARAVLDDLAWQQRMLTRRILESQPETEACDVVTAWLDAQDLTRMRTDRLLSDLKSSGPMTVGKLSFAARHMRSILSRALEG